MLYFRQNAKNRFNEYGERNYDWKVIVMFYCFQLGHRGALKGQSRCLYDEIFPWITLPIIQHPQHVHALVFHVFARYMPLILNHEFQIDIKRAVLRHRTQGPKIQWCENSLNENES